MTHIVVELANWYCIYYNCSHLGF